jgi:hypothetical protein
MRRCIALLLLVAAGGCTPDYPMDKEGTWSVGPGPGANDANLRTMIVNPHDLVVGTGEANSVGPEAAQPVARLFSGKRTALPASNVAKLNIIGAPEQQPQGGSNGGP